MRKVRGNVTGFLAMFDGKSLSSKGNNACSFCVVNPEWSVLSPKRTNVQGA